ncbi:MAG: hypothetical protein IKV16_03565, partial [Clostridia bacterium]|nr:hypothetical protein [Clostridia bacterium]
MFTALKNELHEFYLNGDEERARTFAKHCFKIMDERYKDDMTVTEEKLLQYDVITENFQPKIFPHAPFFFEMGVITSRSDGSRKAKGYGFIQANGWVYKKNEHLFIDQDPELYALRTKQLDNFLYLICGHYNDTAQHYNFNCKPF